MEPETPATELQDGAQLATRLHVDARGLRQAAQLRLAAAAVAALGGVWLFCVTTSLLLRAVAGVSVFFALIWTRSQLRALRAEVGARDYLEIGEQHLAIVDQGESRSLPLSAIRSVSVDEDRLVIVLELEGGPFAIEPRYPGVGLQELAERIQHAVLRAREGARG